MPYALNNPIHFAFEKKINPLVNFENSIHFSTLTFFYSSVVFIDFFIFIQSTQENEEDDTQQKEANYAIFIKTTDYFILFRSYNLFIILSFYCTKNSYQTP
jgi:hypothetical protein